MSPTSRPKLATALTTLLALAAAGLTPEAHAILPPNAAVSASVCNASNPAETKPTRTWGAANYGPKGINVSCPLNRPNTAPVYGVMVYGQVKLGERVNCYLVNMRKQDGFTLGFKLFSFGSISASAGMPGVWVFLEPYERHADAVQEISCYLPPNGGGTLTAFETYAG